MVKVENEKLKIQLTETKKEKKQEQERADNYEKQLKTIIKNISYQQLEKNINNKTELEAKIEQKHHGINQ